MLEWLVLFGTDDTRETRDWRPETAETRPFEHTKGRQPRGESRISEQDGNFFSVTESLSTDGLSAGQLQRSAATAAVALSGRAAGHGRRQTPHFYVAAESACAWGCFCLAPHRTPSPSRDSGAARGSSWESGGVWGESGSRDSGAADVCGETGRAGQPGTTTPPGWHGAGVIGDPRSCGSVPGTPCPPTASDGQRAAVAPTLRCSTPRTCSEMRDRGMQGSQHRDAPWGSRDEGVGCDGMGAAAPRRPQSASTLASASDGEAWARCSGPSRVSIECI